MARTKELVRAHPGAKAPRKSVVTKTPSKAPKAQKVVRKLPKAKALGTEHGHVSIKHAKPRFRPGTVALRDIRKYQKSTDLILRRLPFQRLVRECVQEWKPDTRFQAAALLALQEAAETYIVKLYEDMNNIAVHAKRVTILKKDFFMVVSHFRPDLKEHKTPRAHEMDTEVLDENDERVVRMLRRRVKRAEWIREDEVLRARRADKKKKKD